MTPRLASRFAKVKPIWDQHITDDLIWHHLLGQTIGRVVDGEQEYGRGAVGMLAQALGTTKDVLEDCGKISRTWTPEEIREIAKKTDLYGRRITFGHLSLIAKEKGAGQRRVLIGDVFRQGLTVQQLATRIHKRSRRKGQVSRRSVAAGMRKVQQRASRYLDTEGGSNEEIVDLLAEQIVHGEVPSDTLVELAEKLAVIRVQYKTVVQSAQWTVDRLGQLIRELTQADGGPMDAAREDNQCEGTAADSWIKPKISAALSRFRGPS